MSPEPLYHGCMAESGATSDGDLSYCPRFHSAIEMIGRRWTGAILLALFADVHHFSEIKAAVPGLSDRLLSERLKELEAACIITRCTEGRTVSYCLTERGHSLRTVIDALFEWVDEASPTEFAELG